ncbi:MAG: DUF748 domain-containing protein [Dokdonella sp.]
MLGVVVAVLAIARILLPGWVANTINAHLDRMGDYHGKIQSVDLHLWRGAYSINGLRIDKRMGKVSAPFLIAPRVDLSVSWSALIHGAVVAKVAFLNPEINFVDAPGKGDGQSGQGVDWQAQLQRMAPVRMDEVEVHDGRVRFRNFDSNPPVNLEATKVEGVVRNLTNARKASERAASLNLTAQILGDAPLTTTAQFDPLGTLRDFTFALRVTGVKLPKANDFLQAYAKVDAEKGSGDFVMELTARDGVLDGYAKPLFQDVQIFSWKHDVEEQHDNPLRVAWEALAGGIQNIFKNHRADQFATRVPIHGSVGNKDINTWESILGVLRNAFVEAFRPNFEKLPEKHD